MMILYMCGDSLIAFKGALLNGFGLYLLYLMALVFRDGRPFWILPNIESYGHCYFGFGAPNGMTYQLGFFWLYNLIMYRFKYAVNPNKCVNIFLIIVLFVITCWTFFSCALLGVNFLYQSFIGLIYGLVYLVFCLNFDT